MFSFIMSTQCDLGSFSHCIERNLVSNDNRFS
jgi:hypothetical protein